MQYNSSSNWIDVNGKENNEQNVLFYLNWNNSTYSNFPMTIIFYLFVWLTALFIIGKDKM